MADLKEKRKRVRRYEESLEEEKEREVALYRRRREDLTRLNQVYRHEPQRRAGSDGGLGDRRDERGARNTSEERERKAMERLDIIRQRHKNAQKELFEQEKTKKCVIF